MDHESRPIGERAAILETRVAEYETEFAAIKSDLKDIREKLDSLLHLQSKGMGAIGLVSLIVGSGLIGLITVILQFIQRPHV